MYARTQAEFQSLFGVGSVCVIVLQTVSSSSHVMGIEALLGGGGMLSWWGAQPCWLCWHCWLCWLCWVAPACTMPKTQLAQ